MYDTVSQLGVDIGGSGVRVAAFEPDRLGRFVASDAKELAYEGRGVAECLARCIELLASEADLNGASAILGIAAPGVQTEDGRGLVQARNIPAEEHLLDELATRLQERGLDSVTVPQRLVIDALAALFGETVAAGGLLPGVHEALFIGPGSGLAEARLVDGEAMPVGGTRAVDLPPVRDDGTCADLEEEASLGGLVSRWRDSGPASGGRELSIEAAAESGSPTARAHLERFAAALVRVIEVRSSVLEELRGAGDSQPVILMRTRRGEFFANAAVQSIVVPLLRAAAGRQGATLIVPDRPVSSHVACAGALALTLRSTTPPQIP